MRQNLTGVLLVATLAAANACGKDSTGPGNGLTASVNDPSSDQFGTDSVQPDLVKVTVTHNGTTLTVVLDLASTAIALYTDTIHGVGGFLDFDVDQDSTTGIETWTDFYRATGTTGMGEEYFLDFTTFNADSTVFVVDSGFNPTGSLRPAFAGNRVTFQIPLSMLGDDDGAVNVAAIVGNNFEVTDLAPNAGHLTLGGAGPVAPALSRTAGRPQPLGASRYSSRYIRISSKK